MNLPNSLKTKFSFLAAALFCAASGFSQNTHFSIEPLFGVRYGTLNEYVFSDYNTSSNRKLSQLDWEAKPLFYAGGKASVSYKLFDFAFYGGGFFPGRCGTMYDSDWLSHSNAAMKTNYSESDNVLNSGAFCGTSFSVSFAPLSFLEIAPSVSIDYERYSFTGKNGFYLYGGETIPYNDKRVEKKYFSGDVIDYSRNHLFTWLGLSVRLKPLSAVTFVAEGSASPFIYIDSLDYHILRDRYFYDVMYGFFKSWKCNSEVIWNIGSRISLKAAASFTRINCIKGTSYTSSSEDGPYSELKKSDSEAGAGADFWSWSLSIEYRLF